MNTDVKALKGLPPDIVAAFADWLRYSAVNQLFELVRLFGEKSPHSPMGTIVDHAFPCSACHLTLWGRVEMRRGDGSNTGRHDILDAHFIVSCATKSDVGVCNPEYEQISDSGLSVYIGDETVNNVELLRMELGRLVAYTAERIHPKQNVAVF